MMQETPSSSFSSSKTSRISFVDLAGLERNKQADAGKHFEKECKDLKSSLSHLGYDVNEFLLAFSISHRMLLHA